MTMHNIAVWVNGSQECLDVPSNMTLLQMIREKLALTGTKNGCEAGECGACTVLVDGEPVNSCMMLAVEADGREVTTVEGLVHRETLRVSEDPKGLGSPVRTSKDPIPSGYGITIENESTSDTDQSESLAL